MAALVLAAASCASRPEPAEPERGPIDVWIPGATTERDKEEIAKALAGHPPPRHDRIPPHHCLRHVDILHDDATSWKFLIELAMTHARQLDADAVVVRSQYFAFSDPYSVGPPAMLIEIVRYDADASVESETR